MTNATPLRPIFGALLIVFLSTVAVGAQTATAIAIKPAANVDERLFLTYVLHDLYSSWPMDMSNPQALQQELSDLRHRASRFHEYVKSRNFDPKLTSLYADCLIAIDTYTAFLANIEDVEQEAVARADAEQFETGFNAGFAGGGLAASAYSNGASGGDAVLGIGGWCHSVADRRLQQGAGKRQSDAGGRRSSGPRASSQTVCHPRKIGECGGRSGG